MTDQPVPAIPYLNALLKDYPFSMIYHQLASMDGSVKETALLVKDHIFMMPPDNVKVPLDIKVIVIPVDKVVAVIMLLSYGESVVEMYVNAASEGGMDLLKDFSRQDTIPILFFAPEHRRTIRFENKMKEEFSKILNVIESVDADWSMAEFDAAKDLIVSKYSVAYLASI